MKTIIFHFFLIISASLLYCQSSIVYDAGTIIDIGTNADVCAANIVINGGYIGNGRFCNGTVNVENEVNLELPKEFSLSQNFPNPFNPSTKISFAIPTQEFVTIKIFDVLGRQVAVLVNDVKEPGYYEVNFNANSLPSGTYIYEIRAGNFIETKKMILLK